MTRTYRNGKPSSNPKSLSRGVIKKDSANFKTVEQVNDPQGKFAKSIKAIYVDTDGDGFKDSYGKLHRNPAVNKGYYGRMYAPYVAPKSGGVVAGGGGGGGGVFAPPTVTPPVVNPPPGITPPVTPVTLFSNEKSLSFDSSNEYVKLGYSQANGNTTFQFGTSAFSISAWVKPSALKGADQIIGAHGGSGWTMYSSSGTLTFFADIGNLAGGSLTKDAWNHCLVTRDGTSFNMYLNGAKTSHTVSGTATVDTKTDITTNIGWDTGSLQPLLGIIDEVATWNVALSDADVASIYGNGVTDLNESSSYDTDRSNNLVTWYRNGDTGTDSSGITITNASLGSASAGSSVNGTLINDPTFSTEVTV